jgi:HAUS augmin-like complex subunit 1
MASQWSPGAIFSPSQARQQQVQAKDWNFIDTWLSAKCSPKSAPPFERTNETLKALLALARCNETADEEKVLVARLEAKALEELKTEVRLIFDIHLRQEKHDIRRKIADSMLIR